MRWIFIVILFFSSCSLFDADVKTVDLYVCMYYGTGTFNASPQIEWYSNSVLLFTEYAPTSYYTTYRHSFQTVRYDVKKGYPNYTSKVYYRNALGTILSTDNDSFSVSMYQNQSAVTNSTHY